MKLFRHTILPTVVLLLAACSESQETDQPEDQRPQHTIGITHSNASFTVPEITGTAVSGTVSWGDRKREDYAIGATHSYTASSTYTVTLTLRGAETMELGSLQGISTIDLSGFGPDDNE